MTNDESTTELLGWILAADPNRFAGLDFLHWWRATEEARRPWTTPADHAVVGGFLADRVAFAFAAGYQAALRRLVPALAQDDRVASLSVTEEGGGHPRAILSTLEAVRGSGEGVTRWRLNGRKRWATLAPQAETIFVAASMGIDAEGRNRIRLARIDRAAAGLTIAAMPPTPFAPEIAHAELELVDVVVRADDLLPGDGYLDYVKPFRTIEDTHVNAALLGHLLRVAAAHAWPPEAREELLGLVVQLRSLAAADPSRAAVHVALAGFFSLQQRVFEALEPCWDRVDAETHERWKRDKRLTSVAGTARSKRRDVAWERLKRSHASSE